MYFYIYDSFLVGKKYFKIVSKIETRLSSLDIAGKKIQLSILKSIDEIVKDILEKESPTVVVIGSDRTFCQTAISMAGREATLGFIPTEINSSIANILGLPVDEYACDIISARRIEKFSFGKINGRHFFSSLEFEANKVNLSADSKYQIVPKKVKKIKVINLDLLYFGNSSKGLLSHKIAGNPKDEYLEVLLGTPGWKHWFLEKKEKLDSLFFVKKLEITPKNPKDEVSIKIDKDAIIKAPALVELSKENLKVIVGKDRII